MYLIGLDPAKSSASSATAQLGTKLRQDLFRLGQAGGKLIYSLIFQIQHPLAETFSPHVPKHQLYVGCPLSKTPSTLQADIIFSFYDFHRVKLPSLGRWEDSGLNVHWCVFPAWDCMKEERNHPINYLPTDIFPWASPGGVGDQQAQSAHVLRSTAAVASVRRVHSFLNVIFIPPTSSAFIYCLICRCFHYSLCHHLDAGLQTCAVSELCACSCGAQAQKRLFNDQNASHLISPPLFTSWLAHLQHSWHPAMPPSPSYSCGGAFVRACTCLQSN